MADPRARLGCDDIDAAGLDDWRLIDGTIRAHFRTERWAAGQSLVNAIGDAAEAADHHPDITLTYPAVLVTLWSHDVGGITSRDISLARTISRLAAEAGIGADPASLPTTEQGPS